MIVKAMDTIGMTMEKGPRRKFVEAANMDRPQKGGGRGL